MTSPARPRAHERVEGVPRGGLREVAENSASSGVSFDLTAVALLVEEGEDVLAHPGEAHPPLPEDRRGDAPLLAHQPEQDVLGADVVVEHPLRLLGGMGEDPLALARERDLEGRRDLLAAGGAALHVLPDLVHREAALREEAGGEPLALADEAQQQVLGLDGPLPSWLAS